MTPNTYQKRPIFILKKCILKLVKCVAANANLITTPTVSDCFLIYIFISSESACEATWQLVEN